MRQKEVCASRWREKFASKEIRFLLKKAKEVECRGRTVPGIRKLAQETNRSEFIDLKYPGLDKDTQLSTFETLWENFPKTDHSFIQFDLLVWSKMTSFSTYFEVNFFFQNKVSVHTVSTIESRHNFVHNTCICYVNKASRSKTGISCVIFLPLDWYFQYGVCIDNIEYVWYQLDNFRSIIA